MLQASGLTLILVAIIAVRAAVKPPSANPMDIFCSLYDRNICRHEGNNAWSHWAVQILWIITYLVYGLYSRKVTLPSIEVTITLFLATGRIFVISAFEILCFHMMEPSLRFTATTTPELDGT